MPYRISIIHPSNALYTGYIGDETSLAETTCHTGKPKQGAYLSTIHTIHMNRAKHS